MSGNQNTHNHVGGQEGSGQDDAANRGNGHITDSQSASSGDGDHDGDGDIVNVFPFTDSLVRSMSLSARNFQQIAEFGLSPPHAGIAGHPPTPENEARSTLSNGDGNITGNDTSRSDGTDVDGTDDRYGPSAGTSRMHTGRPALNSSTQNPAGSGDARVHPRSNNNNNNNNENSHNYSTSTAPAYQANVIYHPIPGFSVFTPLGWQPLLAPTVYHRPIGHHGAHIAMAPHATIEHSISQADRTAPSTTNTVARSAEEEQHHQEEQVNALVTAVLADMRRRYHIEGPRAQEAVRLAAAAMMKHYPQDLKGMHLQNPKDPKEGI